VVTGANEVNADHTSATPIAGTGAAPTYAVDVAQLGGDSAASPWVEAAE
jgi:filamentous hemagglutinin